MNQHVPGRADHQHSLVPRLMRRIKFNYHTLQVLKNARPKLRKAIISNPNKDLLHSISECVLKVLNGNIRVSDCAKRRLKRYKSSLRLLVDKRLPRSAKAKFSPARRLSVTTVVRRVAGCS